MILSQIAAMSRNRAIGKDNHLPWNIPEDLRYFQDKTKGHCVIMGRKTFYAIGNKPLKTRLNVIVTKQKDLNFPYQEVKVVSSIKEAFAFCKEQIDKKLWPEEVFICGGSQIYEQTLDIVHRIYLTLIQETYEGDTFFPLFDKEAFELISATPSYNNSDINPPLTFLVYERKKIPTPNFVN